MFLGWEKCDTLVLYFVNNGRTKEVIKEKQKKKKIAYQIRMLETEKSVKTHLLYMVATVASCVCCSIALGTLECDSSGLAVMDEKLDEFVVIYVAPPWAPTWLYHWRHPLVVVVEVLCSGFALLDESVALVSLG